MLLHREPSFLGISLLQRQSIAEIPRPVLPGRTELYAPLDIFRNLPGLVPYRSRKAAVNWLPLLYPTDWATSSTVREEPRSSWAARSIRRCRSQAWTASPYRCRKAALKAVGERNARRLNWGMDRGSSKCSSIYRATSSRFPAWAGAGSWGGAQQVQQLH